VGIVSENGPLCERSKHVNSRLLRKRHCEERRRNPEFGSSRCSSQLRGVCDEAISLHGLDCVAFARNEEDISHQQAAFLFDFKK